MVDEKRLVTFVTGLFYGAILTTHKLAHNQY